ncbi:MAG: class I SAM-dependent methyltransferase [Anaerolineae bacterium]|nr:class I SAM-dependent methyltransferase [Anaerolineae bacterium]
MSAFSALWLRLIRLAFRLFYNPLAWTYDPVSWIVSQGHWRRWQRTALEELTGTKVLDLAFGTGNMLVDLALAGFDMTGLDLSPTMGRIARHKLRRAGLPIPLVRGRAQQLPFPDAHFDAVLSTFPANFIFSGWTLSEVARVLKPGGRFVVVAMGLLKGRDGWSRFLEWLYRITAQRMPVPDLDELLAPAGLSYRTVWRSVGNTEVLIYLLEHIT